MLQHLFDNIRAKALWSVDEPCLWGYFFIDTDRIRLLAAARELESLG